MIKLRGPDGYEGIFINEEEAFREAHRRYGADYVNTCKFEQTDIKPEPEND